MLKLRAVNELSTNGTESISVLVPTNMQHGNVKYSVITTSASNNQTALSRVHTSTMPR